MNTTVVDGLLIAFGVVPLCMSAYLALLTVLSGRRAAPLGRDATRFDVVVPAHNEAAGITATVHSLRSLNYPADRRRIFVIADNCTDDTAVRARAAGARVLERAHATERGKGYALDFAYQHCLSDGFADAVVVVDADSSVTPNLLTAFAARFATGALALQAEYGVRNANASWRTRLMVIALTMFHTVRSLGRERLGLSCGLRGNGMAFSTQVLRTVPPRAYSVVEDVEYGISLGLAGVRVEYVHEAHVLGDMPVSSQASRVQRERWEGGRMAMVTTHVPALLRAASRRAGRAARVPLDLALDLMVPPLTTLGVALVIGLAMAAAAWATSVGSVAPMLIWSAAALCLAMYVIRGMVLSGTGLRAVRDMLWLPVFVLWKLTASVRRTSRPGEWVRTPRADEQ